ncbi:Hypothetical predicted protein [Mytilus galloprovincialis]|uniref:Uncharacterized protein n=2 Tax=Mytilus galloprovincialis TaxID=29158 RepID=A0A8B6GE88_MYTGA|nr:Hypothetical predicted protein [Mytilus galloprovincialis]
MLDTYLLFLNVNQSDYIPYVSDDPGVVLSIHENGYRPFLQSNGFSVSPGFKTDISLVQRRKERNRAVFGSNDLCDDSGKFRNLQACFEVCKETVVEKNCNCSPTLSDIHLGLGLCENITELQCMTEAVKRIDSCGCKEPCRESLLFINIYFTSLQEEITEEELAYTVENFWSDIGGSLGLWVGMSVISLAEILELGILILRLFRKRTFRLHTKEQKRANAEAKLNAGLNQIIKGFNDINEDEKGGRIEVHDGLTKIINSINILAAEKQKSENDQNAIEISILENDRMQPEQNNVYARQEFVVE